MSPVERERLRKALLVEEGLRLKPYTDTVGKLTIGIGRNLTDVGISAIEADYLLNNDIDKAIASLLSRYSWWADMTPARQHVLLQMTFQMGADGVAKFVRTLAAMKAGDYEAASKGMLASKWARLDTPARAKRLAAMMKSGEYPEIT